MPDIEVSLMSDEPTNNRNNELAESRSDDTSLLKLLLDQVEYVAFITGFIIWLIVIIYTSTIDPSFRYFELYNPAIDLTTLRPNASYSDTIPYWMIVFIFVFFVGILSLIEMVKTRRHYNLRITTVVAFTLSHAECSFLTTAATRSIKFYVGFLRPDFAHRCFDPFPANLSTVSLPVECTSTDTEAISKGRESFPSGHSSTAAATGFYTSLYLLWCVYLRNDDIIIQKLISRWPGLQSCFFLPCLLPFYFGIYISLTRITDFRHHPLDVVTGILIGMFFATLVFARTALKASSTLD